MRELHVEFQLFVTRIFMDVSVGRQKREYCLVFDKRLCVGMLKVDKKLLSKTL